MSQQVSNIRPSRRPQPKQAELRFDISTPLALGLALCLILTVIALGGPLGAFLDIRSVLMVFGGTITVTAAGFSAGDLVRAMRGARFVFMVPSVTVQSASTQMVRLAEMVRKDGIHKLENHLGKVENQPFLHKALAMVVDNLPIDTIESVLSDELRSMDDRHRRTAAVFRRAADVAPAMGLVGTMIGLIHMLRMLDDPSAIGPAMALAMLTTLYGAVLGHMICAPLAARLERRSATIYTINTVHALGAIALARQDSPRHLELAINAHLSPRDQTHRFTL